MPGRSAIVVGLIALLAAGASSGQPWSGSAGLEIRATSGRGSVAGAVVRVSYRSQAVDGGPAPVATDGNGRATVTGLAAGTWQVEVSHPDYMTFVAVVELAGDDKPQVTASFLEATETSTASMRVRFGRARGPASPPLPGAAEPPSPPAASTVEPAEPEPEPELEGDAPPHPEAPAPPATPEPDEPPVPPPAPPEPPSREPEPPAGPDAEAPPAVPEPEAPAMPEAEPEPAPEEPPTPAEPVPPEPAPPTPEQPAEPEDAPDTDEPPAPEAPPPPGRPAEPEDVPERDEAPAPEAPPAPGEPAEPEPPAEPDEPPAPERPTEPGEAPDSDEPPAPDAPPMPGQPAEPGAVPEPDEPAAAPPTVEPPTTPVEPPAPGEAPPGPEPAPAPQVSEPAVPPTPEVPPAPDVPPAPEAAPTPGPAPVAPVAPPAVTPLPPVAAPEAAPVRSYSRRTCFECRPGEWAVADRVVSAGAAACSRDDLEALEGAMAAVAESDALELAAYAGPLAGARDLLDAATLATLDAALAAVPPGCAVAAVVLPRNARFSAFQYEASAGGPPAPCLPDQPCEGSKARWQGPPLQARGANATIAYGLFRADAPTAGYLTVYFTPAAPGWEPDD